MNEGRIDSVVRISIDDAGDSAHGETNASASRAIWKMKHYRNGKPSRATKIIVNAQISNSSAAKVWDSGRSSLFFVEMDNHFGIGLGIKTVSTLFELWPEI